MISEQPWAGDAIPEVSGVIEVHLVDLRQLFNSMDPSPFHEKDLDADAEEFIVSWAKEFPENKPLALLVHLDKPAVMPEAGTAVSGAIHSHFARRAEQSRQRLHQLLRIGRTSLFIGLLFLAACLMGGDWVVRLLPGSRVASILRESLLIGGWVAMWRPLQIFLYDWWPIREERRIYDRLSHMPVRIACTGKGSLDESAPSDRGRAQPSAAAIATAPASLQPLL